MNYNDFVGERIIQGRKAESQATADSYFLYHEAGQVTRTPTVTVRLLASVGGVLITFGYRLQARCETMTSTVAERNDTIRLAGTGSQPTNC